MKTAMKSALDRCGLHVSSAKSQRARERMHQERQGALLAERDGLIAERDGLAAREARLLAERDGLAAERDGLAARADALLAERDGLIAEREGLVAERHGLAARADALLAELDTLRPGNALRAEKDPILFEVDYLFAAVLAAHGGGVSRAQLNQDILALIVNGFRTGGFFVEFGATNGVDLSNTWLLEKDYGWTGILAEPATIWHEDLARNRACAIDTDCVWSVTGETLDFDMVQEGEFSTISDFAQSDGHAETRENKTTYKVDSISLLDLLRKHGAPDRIGYLSIDTEGSEYEILRAFDFDAYRFDLITVEHNFTPNRERLKDLLERNGYRRICEHISRWDDWYVSVR